MAKQTEQPAQEAPEEQTGRNHRKVRQGVVVSISGDKTCVVQIKVRKPHPVYGKMMTRSSKCHAHDATNQAGLGDVVQIMETRPLSKLKRWRLLEIVEKAK
ncbi:MAG: 30S ribosomal protein S17 [Coriobacteriales bacterium]|jgi:small subunit ribosomal protein S17|nr:30S ribosomal protein S17 [Coriobacteriales bacterium]